ncbi:MAG: amidohydrolase [Paracoccaceae bacterium]
MLVLRDARIFDRPGRWALTIIEGRIAWIGPESDAPHAGKQIDLGGATLLPGFCDSHVHLFGGGAALGQLNLAAVHSAPDLARAVADWATAHPGSQLISAYGANYDLIGSKGRPDRHALDAALPDRPLYIAATDFHCAWANTEALRQAGILHGSPVEGVMTGSDGLASGELQEFAAMDLVKAIGPTGGREGLGLVGAEPASVSPADRTRDIQTLRQAVQACLALGITSVCNMDGNIYQAELLTELARADALDIDISLPMTLVPGMSTARREALYLQAAMPPIGRLRFGAVKMFMDGVFDTWTAFRTDDYPDRPGFRGTPLFSPAEYARNCIEADARGLQIATHAVGDGAVRAALDGYAAAAMANGRRDSRHRIEHIDMIHPDDLPRLRDLGVVASMQPVHPPGSSGLPLEPTISIMGKARWRDTFAWRAILDSGSLIAFGTDWPVSPLSPFNALHSALSRRPWAKDGPDMRLDLAECLAAYSAAGAMVRFADAYQGQIAVGMQADLIAVSGDLAKLANARDACRVIMTISKGKIAFQS